MSNLDRYEAIYDLAMDKAVKQKSKDDVLENMTENMNISGTDEEKAGAVLEDLIAYWMGKSVKGAVDKAHKANIKSTKENARKDFD